MKAGQKLAFKGVQVALFPMQTMRVTQSPDEGFSHKGTKNIDIAGKDSGIENLYAPCDLTCVQNNNTSYHTVIFWSDEKVMLADGSVDYISIRVLHDNDVKDTPVGKKFKQGDVFYQEGTAGYATGNHVHLCVAKGHTKRVVKHASGWSDLSGSIMPNDAFLVNDTIIKDDGGLKWKTFVEPVEPEAPFKVGDRVKVIGVRYATKQLIPFWVKIRTLTVGQIKGDRALLKEIQSWVYIKDLKKV